LTHRSIKAASVSDNGAAKQHGIVSKPVDWHVFNQKYRYKDLFQVILPLVRLTWHLNRRTV